MILRCVSKNFFQGSRTAIRIPAAPLIDVLKKWIRGVHYCEIGQLITDHYTLSVQFVEDKVAVEAFSEIARFATRIQRGPGVEILIWHAEECGESMTQYAFNIWQAFRAYGSVEKL
jgi:hypothetical protein